VIKRYFTTTGQKDQEVAYNIIFIFGEIHVSVRAYHAKEDILAHGHDAVSILLREIDKTDKLKTGKGVICVLEGSWFGYHISSLSKADFIDAGI
jgi:hypothetical protein